MMYMLRHYLRILYDVYSAPLFTYFVINDDINGNNNLNGNNKTYYNLDF